ncbi:MAG: glycosyltransferase family 4 protein [Thermoplasmata archaeon]|nr:MAG: glycosyltransferase family 4 protein [Thermoplasmata archaeon]
MKILAVSRRFPPEIFGGGEISVYQWCRLLAENNEVHVLTSSRGEEHIDGISVHRLIPPIKNTWPLDLHNNEIFYINAYKSLVKLLENERFDIIHAFNMISIPPAVYASKRKKIPVIATVNDHWGTCYFRSHFHEGKVWEVCPSSVLKRNLERNEVSILALPYILYTMRLRKHSMRKCGKLIAVSNWVKRILKKNGFNNVNVINNPVDLEAFKPKKFKSTGNVLYIGRLDRGKGIETLIEATGIAQKNISFNLIMAGTGNIEFYKRFAVRHDVSAEFIGKVPYSEMSGLIQDSEVVVAPFERVEAFPRAVTEAAACGRAVITTNISGSVDIVEDEKNGKIVPPQNPEALGRAISDLLKDKAKLKAMGNEGRRIVENKLNNDILLKELMNVYNGVIGAYGSVR